ncbi:MAG: NYN domain-containing protein [Deltaproteobacteria bacterium]|nr:NYN domain-containing protein [Deltaproteobacteria bacterium]
MSLRLAIDGYNIIGATYGMEMLNRDIEGVRDMLIKRLAEYRKSRAKEGTLRMTVVFDGTRSGRLSRSREMVAGIEVVFSRSGELADHILKEMAKNTREGLTLVTSDRDVADYAKRQESVVISSEEFNDILEMAAYSDMKGVEMEDEDEIPSGVGGAKKGPARRLSKVERKKKKRLKKL